MLIPKSHRVLPQSGGSLIRQDFARLNKKPEFDTILITGGTGVIGRWLLSHLDTTNKIYSTFSDVYLVTRKYSAARNMLSGLSNINLNFLAPHDIRPFITRSKPQFIWHLSADTGTQPSNSVLGPIDADLQLTLEICRGIETAGYAPRILYTSSGAVYGRPSAPMTPRSPQMPISDLFSDSSMLYGHSKLLSESLLIMLAKQLSVSVNIARIFAVAGPLLPLDKHYAVGNFVRDGLLNQPIHVASAGKSVRSWIYLGDVARCLLVLASLPTSNILDLGSSERLTIREAADVIAAIAGTSVELAQSSDSSSSDSEYLPNLSGLSGLIEMETLKTFHATIGDWFAWLRS